MGLIPQPQNQESHHHTHKFFLFSNYILLGASSSCIFLTLSLRLIPSLCGFFLILLQATTIIAAISGCVAASYGNKNRWYAAHMITTVLTAIFQGSVSVLIFTDTSKFLESLNSYVLEEDAALILKLAGGLCVLIFVVEWIVLVLAFFLKFNAFVDGDGGGNNGVAMKRSNGKVHEENPWSVQV